MIWEYLQRRTMPHLSTVAAQSIPRKISGMLGDPDDHGEASLETWDMDLAPGVVGPHGTIEPDPPTSRQLRAEAGRSEG